MKSIANLCLLILLVCSKMIYSQEQSKQLKSEIDKLVENLETYYTDPAKYKNKLLHLSPSLDSLLIEYPNDIGLLYAKAKFNDYLGFFKSAELKPVETLKLYEESERILQDIDSTKALIPLYRSFAYVWGRQRNYTREKEYYAKALQLAQEHSDQEEILMLKDDLATFKVKEVILADGTNYQEAIDDYLALAQEAEEQVRWGVAARINKNLALAMRLQEQVAASLPYLLKAKEFYEKINHIPGLGGVAQDLGNYYGRTGDYKKSVVSFRESIDQAQKQQDSVRLSARYQGLSRAYQAQGDFKEALAAYKEHAYLQSKIVNLKNTRLMLELEDELREDKRAAVDSLRFEKEKQIQAVTLKRKANTRFWVVVSGLGLILGIVFFLLYRNKQQVREQAYQNILLNNKIAGKTDEVNKLLTETIAHIKSKDKIAAKLKDISKNTDNTNTEIKSILTDLKANQVDRTKLLVLKENIEAASYDFRKTLETNHPNLTKTDIEICTFIRIGLSRSEVASLRNTSMEAVKSSRFRLKKKLNLRPKDGLDDYVKSL